MAVFLDTLTKYEIHCERAIPRRRVPKIVYRTGDDIKAGFAASAKAHDEIFAKLRATGLIHRPRRNGPAISPARRG
jgi:hypothetical protein